MREWEAVQVFTSSELRIGEGEMKRIRFILGALKKEEKRAVETNGEGEQRHLRGLAYSKCKLQYVALMLSHALEWKLLWP